MKKLLIVLLISFNLGAMFIAISPLANQMVRAAEEEDAGFEVTETADPEEEPEPACNTVTCGDADGDGNYDFEPDYACILAKTFNTPGEGRVDCCVNKCKGEEGEPVEILPEEYRSFDIFNIRVNISYEKLPTLINFGFSTFLAILSIYAAIRGIYIYAIKMPNAKTDDEIAAVSKDARAILIGFILALSFLFFTQIVFSILGLPGLNEIQVSTDPNDAPDGSPGITIQ